VRDAFDCMGRQLKEFVTRQRSAAPRVVVQ
jgi:hypothetical protein